MTITQWFIFFLAVQVIHFLGTWKLYVRAGRQAWEAAVPVYNAVILMKIINRPWWWTILLFVPIVNLIMFPVVWTETARSYGFNTYKDTALVVLTCGLYLFYINYATDAAYIKERDLNPKSSSGEWVSSILFAIVAATIVHTYFMQPFTIPTSSLEKTLLVGDYLFVSKFHYGARAPMTTVATPMLHDAIPFTGAKSYASSPELPYFRIPGFQKIKQNDIVVFSWPVDTLTVITDTSSEAIYKPVDKKSNYVKRCVGLPGDSLEVRDGYVYTNGVKNELPDRARLQFSYIVETKSEIPRRIFINRYDITDDIEYIRGRGYFIKAATDEAIARLENHPDVINITKNTFEGGDQGLFPRANENTWSTHNYGPIYIPEQGNTVAINPNTIPSYKRIIEVYEGSEMGIDNDIRINGTEVTLNGAPITEYTFKQDYYWMMGDNRHNSQDARMWGYTPYTHVVGKPVFVWFSLDPNKNGFLNRIRWDRVFTTVGGDGKLTSYRYHFLGFLILYFGFNFFRNKKKKQKA
ncbi:MAG: signal peptidase I [Dokdonia sp.]|jgi:signal peptidase I